MATASVPHGRSSSSVAPRASRVAACVHLTPEHAVERQRALDEPTVVAYKEERSANGQVLISISSSESNSGDDNSDDSGDGDDESEYEYEEDEEEDDDGGHESGDHSQHSVSDESDHGDSVSNGGALYRRRKRHMVIELDDDDGSDEDAEIAVPCIVKAEVEKPQSSPIIYSIDSDDDDEDVNDGAGSECVHDVDGDDAREAAETHAAPHEPGSDESVEAEGGTTTPEHNSASSEHDENANVRSEAAPPPQAKRKLPPVPRAESPPVEPIWTARESLLPPVEAQVPAIVREKRVRVVPKKAIPLMRKRKMNEEDAAFLLFYGISETPTTYILGLIIGTHSWLVSCAQWCLGIHV